MAGFSRIIEEQKNENKPQLPAKGKMEPPPMKILMEPDGAPAPELPPAPAVPAAKGNPPAQASPIEILMEGIG